MAKPSGEIIETPDHGELPRRPDGAGVLHLDPRRAQGPGRYGSEDGRFRLPDAPPGGRGAGRDHQRIRLRHGRWHLRELDRGIGRDHRAAARPYRGPRFAGEDQGLRRQHHRRHQPGDHGRPGGCGAGCGYRAGEDSLGADLRIQARRLRHVLRPQPGLGPSGRAGRGHGRHRGAVHRRAGNPAHHAYLPHRRYGIASQRAVAPRCQEQRHGALHQPDDGALQGRPPGGDEPQRLASPWWTTRAAKKSATRWCTAPR